MLERAPYASGISFNRLHRRCKPPSMGMSYKRAWYLIDTLNGYFRAPFVSSAKGGRCGRLSRGARLQA